jgi:hypothetical protein
VPKATSAASAERGSTASQRLKKKMTIPPGIKKFLLYGRKNPQLA